LVVWLTVRESIAGSHSRQIGPVVGPVQLRTLTLKLSITVLPSVWHYASRVKHAEGRNQMPLIQVRVIKDVFSKEQKGQIISKLTDAIVSIERENMRGVTWCVIEEVESGDWGIGGNALTTADVHALARGKAA
jgi:4-oxalocrotonate tautomerase